LGEGSGVCRGDGIGILVVRVLVVVVLTYYGAGRLDIGDAKRGQLGPVVVQAMFMQREGRLGRHGGGG
jgi:hypothetical protein